MIELIEIIEDLLTEFDEMGFMPTTSVPDPDAYAIEWKNKLTDALQELIKQSEWISVAERLPKNYRPVLVACEGLTIGGYAPIAIGSYGGGFWSLADADGTAYLTKYMRCTVTHWMPLPEPPKMKGGE